jgi:N-acetylmuramate 1-kinase
MAVIAFDLLNEAATNRFGNDLSRALTKGDVLALHGDLGAGKTSLSRAIIRSLADDPDLDVPSPTFTLVQSYDTKLPAAHFDLYRLNDASELDELGLDEALETGIALIEWPERAGNTLPASTIHLVISHKGTGRSVEISGPDEAMARIQRSLNIRAFLMKSGNGDALRKPFVGDASPRVYETFLDAGGTELILMDQRPSPAGPAVWKGLPYRDVAHTTNPTVHPFIAIGTALADKGFATPRVYARDLKQNILVLEHLGKGSFLAEDGAPIQERYELAAQLLANIHEAGIAQDINAAGIDWHVPPFDRDALMIEVSLALDWYFPYRLGREASDAERAEFASAWDEQFTTLDSDSYGLLLRDYHSPNIVWRPELKGFDRLGVLDYQDALWGPNAYDLASLAQDARVTIAPEMEAAIIRAYINSRTKNFDAASFASEYALMALQRNTKILGIFIRLERRDNKPYYRQHLPRIEAYVRATLMHPALARLARFYADMGLQP